MKKLYLTLLCCFLAAMTAWAQFTSAPAFPGAEGYGRYTTGGRGGEIRHVTNLNDSGTGSFRAAVSGDAAKIVVFDVGGIIALSSNITIGSNTTILGQTAPGDGITLRYYTLGCKDNCIIRFIRIRRGQELNINDGADAFFTRHQKNIIIDHCSFSWGIDECFSFYDNHNTTLQWSTIGEGLANSGHTKGEHCYGGIWGGKGASFHHNLLIHFQNRTPRLNGARYGCYVNDEGGITQIDAPTTSNGTTTYDSRWEKAVEDEQVDVRNLVIYNKGNGNGAYAGMGGYHNYVNNYYKVGPATTNGTRVFQMGHTSGTGDDRIPGNIWGHFLFSGNDVDYATFNSDKSVKTETYYSNRDWDGVIIDNETSTTRSEYKLTSPISSFKNEDITTHTAKKAYEKVLQYAGASLVRDAVDTRYADETTNRTTHYIGSATKQGDGSSVTHRPGIIDIVADQGTYTLQTASRPSGFDTDGDGIPDEWETAHGLNPNTNDANLYTIDNISNGGKGYYTNIEVYANSLVEDIMKNENKDAQSSIDEYYPALAGGGSSTDPDPETPTVTETIYSWESPSGTIQETGGTLTYTNGVSDPRVNVNTYNYYTIELMGKMANLSDATASENAGYMNIALNSALQEGDVIKLTGFRRKDSDAGANAYLLFNNNTNTTIGGSDGLGFVNRYSDSSIVPNEVTYTVSSENSGATSFKLTRGSKAGTTLFITKIEIVRESEPEPIKVTSVIVSPANKTIEVGEKLQLSAQVLPDDAEDKSVTWRSSDETIAEVDATGKVTAKATGTNNTVKITATAADGSGKSDYCLLTVVAKQSGTSGNAIVWDFTQESAQTFTEGETYSFTANDNSTQMTYKAGKDDKVDGYLRENGTSNNSGSRCITLKVYGEGKLSIYCSTTVGVYECYNGSASGTKLGNSYTAYSDAQNPTSTSTINVTDANGLFIKTITKGYIYKITWTPITAPTTQYITKHISESTWASFVPEKSVKVPDNVNNVKVYYIKSGSYNSSANTVQAVQIEAGTVIKGDDTNTYGYIVNAAAEGNYQFEVSATEGQIFSDNILKCGKNEPIDEGSLVFGRIDGESGFYGLNSYEVNVPYGITYLPVDVLTSNGGSAPASVGIVFNDDEEVTVVRSANEATDRKPQTTDFFNINGQKVGADFRGIVIKNGRKYIRR